MKRIQFSSNKEIDSLLNNVVRKIDSFVQKQRNKIERLTNIGLALSSETDINDTFETILEGALDFTSADGATLYIVSADKQELEFKLVYNRSLLVRFGGKSKKPVPWPSVKLYHNGDERNLNTMVTYVFHTGKAYVVDDVYEQRDFDNSGTLKYDKENNYRSKSMIGVPLKNNDGDVLGVIQLLNATSSNGKVVSFSEEQVVLLKSLASQAAIALTNKSLIAELERLLHDFVKTIAYTLDQKSRYSGKHISRVATLTEMLSNKVHECECEAYKDVSFSESQLEEISMSGWLHDIGKIVTPEYIMDKSTKLEKIIDLIEIIELRFALVKTAVEKKILHLQLAGKAHKKIVEYEKLLAGFDDDLEFVRKLNIGAEFVEDSAIERLKRIRDFRFNDGDRDYYLISEEEHFLLSVRKGTLSPQDLVIMREHVVKTDEILSQLSFPKKFGNLQLYASSHHEKINGKGYPKGLKGEELPVQARIIAIADIFEAITAADRPYRKGNKLSAALKIMAFMVRDGELDNNLYTLLLDSGLYLEYANKYLKKEQIDEVDIEQLKSIAAMIKFASN
jgi:HD-GYP domain-containing protein (c-di-GMP phosphodiesterase class II)